MFKLLFEQLLVAFYCFFIVSACSSATSAKSPSRSTVAKINIARTDSSGFISGDGTHAYPYAARINTNPSITYSYTNSGTADAKNFYLTIAKLPDGWHIDTNNCGTIEKAITLPISGVNTCSITFSLENSDSASKLAFNGFNQNLITANWSDSSHLHGVSQQALANITYVNNYMFSSSHMTIAQTKANFNHGDGSKEAPFLIRKNCAGNLTFTYANNGTLNATNFYVTIDTLPIGWSLDSNSCGTSSNPITLSNNANNTCSLVFEFSRGEIGINEFKQNIITAHWSDSDHPSGTYSQASSHTRYIRVVSD